MPRPEPSRLDKFLSASAFVAGLLLMALGAIGLLLPTHLLGALFVIGLVMVLKNSISARRRFMRLKRRYPRYFHPLRRLMRRNPEIAPVLWREMLRSERWWLRKGPRRLVQWRRGAKRKTRPTP